MQKLFKHAKGSIRLGTIASIITLAVMSCMTTVTYAGGACTCGGGSRVANGCQANESCRISGGSGLTCKAAKAAPGTSGKCVHVRGQPGYAE